MEWAQKFFERVSLRWNGLKNFLNAFRCDGMGSKAFSEKIQGWLGINIPLRGIAICPNKEGEIIRGNICVKINY